MSERIRFSTASGPVEATASVSEPDGDAAGARVRVDVAADDFDRAYDARAFDLAAMIPGGHVPVPDRSQPVTLELRLADEHDVLLAPSSREPQVLLGDLVALTDAGRDEHVLLDAASWQVTAVVQHAGGHPMHLVTLHDSRPAAASRESRGDA